MLYIFKEMEETSLYKVSKSLRTADLLYAEKKEKGISFKNLGGFKVKWLVAWMIFYTFWRM